MHFSNLGLPYVLVYTGGDTWQGWSTVFSHEIVETLVDPVSAYYYHDAIGYAVEVADPVEHFTYRLRDVYVSDFVLRAWCLGATTSPRSCTGSVCDYGTQVISDSLAGPWDHMRALTGASQDRSAG